MGVREIAMQIEYDSDGQPCCPDCGMGLSCESAGNRDSETTGGFSVEYFRCDRGCGQFEVIDGEIYPSGSLP